MRKIFAVLPMLAIASIAAPAFAQEADAEFSGPYVGVSAGQTSVKNRTSVDPVQFDTNRDGTYGDPVLTSTSANAFAPGFCAGQASGNAPTTCDKDKKGVQYSARVGYDVQSGSTVFGALVEFDKSEASDFSSAYSSTPAGYHFARDLDYSVSARVRAGFTPAPKLLVYGTGGGSYARINHSFSTTNTANSFTPTNDDEMVWGWQAGGGAELKLGSALSVGVEYLYNRYNDNKYYVAIGQGTAAPTNPFLLNGGGTNARQDSRFAFDTLRATVNLRF